MEDFLCFEKFSEKGSGEGRRDPERGESWR